LTSDRRRIQEKVQKILARYQKKIARAIANSANLEPDFEALFNDLRAALGPEIAAITTQQALGLATQTGITFDMAVISEEAVRWAREYTYDLVRGLTDTTRNLVQQATSTWFETPGMTLGDLTRLLDPAFGPVRAEMIAVTEVTRADSAAVNQQQQLLAEQGIEMRRVWTTRHDEVVCEICGPLNGLPEEDWKVMFPEGPPAHPNCRCGALLSVQDASVHRDRAKELAKEREAYIAGEVQP